MNDQHIEVFAFGYFRPNIFSLCFFCVTGNKPLGAKAFVRFFPTFGVDFTGITNIVFGYFYDVHIYLLLSLFFFHVSQSLSSTEECGLVIIVSHGKSLHSPQKFSFFSLSHNHG